MHLMGVPALFVDFHGDAPDGSLEPFAVDRLEQVVHGVVFERVDGELVEGGAEHHSRPRRLEARGNVESRQSRHLDVQEHNVRRRRGDLRQRFCAIRRFTDDLDVRAGLVAVGRPHICQKPPQAIARRFLVVDDEAADYVSDSVTETVGIL